MIMSRTWSVDPNGIFRMLQATYILVEFTRDQPLIPAEYLKPCFNFMYWYVYRILRYAQLVTSQIIPMVNYLHNREIVGYDSNGK